MKFPDITIDVNTIDVILLNFIWNDVDSNNNEIDVYILNKR